MQKRKSRVVLWVLGGLTALTLWGIAANVCISGFLRYGILVGRCPDGTPRAGVDIYADGLRRGAEGFVEVGAPIFYTTGPASFAQQAYTARFDAELSLRRGQESWPLTPVKGWQTSNDRQHAKVVLPKDLPDGDYRLHAKLDTPLGEVEHDVALPIYAPARVHTLTDRPLYEPGNVVRFRAVILRARDMSPLESRPGVFKVTDATGQVVYEQKAPAGPFGVASGDFPLDDAAPTGVWWVAYESGDASDSVSIRVEPFTLPRFTVEARPAAAFYGVGDAPVVRGRVVYSSGAPVSGARLDLRWSVAGAWPAPTSWMQGGLPKTAYTEDDGRFELRLPRVPGDLVEQAFLRASIEAIDPSGDRARGGVSVLLSKDRIAASAVTELDGGLVDGFNNRVYLRVTTADGQPLPNTALTVTRAWDATDEGKEAKTDADGVAALQIDPGPAVNVLRPAPPVRPPPRPDPVRRSSARDLTSDAGVSLADQVRLDRAQASLAPCARFVEDGTDAVQVGLLVGSSGRVESVSHQSGALDACVGRVARGFTLSPGAARVIEVEWALTEDLPSLELDWDGTPAVPDLLRQAWAEAALDARRCLPEDVAAAELSTRLLWSLAPGARKAAFRSVPNPGARTVGGRVADCVTSTLRGATFAEAYPKAAQPAFGVTEVSIVPGPRYESSQAPDRTELGYELSISARAADEALGTTKLFLRPGQVPDLRLRATPVLATSGEEVALEVLRGPGFRGKLPKKLWWSHEGRRTEMKLDSKTRTARFTIPEGAHGWFEVELRGARALVYVRPSAELAVQVKADREVYAPGASAKLTVLTRAGDRGTPAAVGLFGVDQTLEQLAPLLGPDAMARMRPLPKMKSMAFGALDAQALTQGRVRGAAAAAATVVRVQSIPAPEALDRSVSANGRTDFEPVEALTDNFYRVLGGLYAQVRTWEKSAPKDEQMRPATMARLWQAALTEIAEKGAPAVDAYGRSLTLGVLPDDLLALIDPRAVVVDGTRLPEDVENWTEWVRKEHR